MLKRIFVFFMCMLLPVQGFAQANLPLVRDAEVEELLAEYARPILAAAGQGGRGINIILMGDKGFNAFVVDGQRIFITTGAIAQSQTPNEIIGVLAHETGHIAGGHLARLREQLSNAQTLSILSLLLGAGALVAAGTSGRNAGNFGDVAPGLLLGPQEAIKRNFLAYQRSEEMAADRAAITYLEKTGQSGLGMLKTFERFKDENKFLSSTIDRYALSHPMPEERIEQLEQLVRKSGSFQKADSSALKHRHDMARAKIIGFTEPQASVLRQYGFENSLPAKYARTIAAYRAGQYAKALQDVEGLLASSPGNVYFHELKGQILLDYGRPVEALAPLKLAASKKSGSGLIRGLYGHALLASGVEGNIKQSITHLRVATQRESEYSFHFRLLSQAYGRVGDIALAEWASAEAYALEGDFISAKEHAFRAREKLKKGSTEWNRADYLFNRKKSEL